MKNRHSNAVNAIEAALDIGKKVNRNFVGPLAKIQNILGVDNGSPTLLGFSKFVEKICGWIPLNPNDLERSKAIVSAYHLEDPEGLLESVSLPCNDQSFQGNHLHKIQRLYDKEIKSSDANFPHVGAFHNLFWQICSPNGNVIAISGRRGAGKTVALNFFLVTAHKKLSERGVLWLRTDVAKLWAMQTPEEGVSISVATYTMLHSIFIFLRYADEDPCLTSFREKGKEFNRRIQK